MQLFGGKNKVKRKNKGNKGAKATIPVLTRNSPFAMAEAYRTLRTNITFSLPNKGCKLIGITSALISEGKSTNARNIAVAFAETGVRVLLIDCDMRRPALAKGFGIPASPGLSNVLVNLADLDQTISRTEHACLDILPSGDIPPNPTELLGSAKMKEILDRMALHYDYIFIDLPPVCMVADAVIMSRNLHGLLFVVRQGESDQESIKHAVSQLQFAEAKILGFVLHGVEAAKNNRYGRKGYYRYGYGYSYTYTNQKDKKS